MYVCGSAKHTYICVCIVRGALGRGRGGLEGGGGGGALEGLSKGQCV